MERMGVFIKTTICLLAVVLLSLPSLHGQIILNEFLADPPPGEAGDANRDGNRSSTQDEFVELVNTGETSVDISSWQLTDRVKVRHTFPPNTVIPAGAAIVVFGGGSPTGSFSGAIVQTADSGTLSLNNSGDTISLINSAGDTVLTHSYGSEAGKDESLSRSPDLTGDFVGHSSIPEAQGALFSPGSRADGTAFSPASANSAPVLDPIGDRSIPVGRTLSFRVTANDDDGDTLTYSAENLPAGATFAEQTFSWTPDSVGVYPGIIFKVEDGRGGADTDTITITVTELPLIVINEFLADPPPGSAGDANGDGVRNSSEDEFIELVNTGDSEVDLSNWSISDATRVRHTFPVGTRLAPEDVLLVFGGGNPQGGFGHARVQTASSGSLSLNNNGDTISLLDASGRTTDSHSFGREGGKNQSLTRSPDIRGEFVLHEQNFGTPFSPGTKSDGTPFPGVANTPPVLAEIGDKSVTAGDTLRFHVAATDADGDTLYFEAENLPAGAQFENAEFFWLPADAGTFGPITFRVRDDYGGQDSEEIIITVTEPEPPAVVINEVCPNPRQDANGDGTVSSDDRFIELLNITDSEVDISGFSLRIGAAVQHSFPQGTVIPAGEAYVIFSGGSPQGYFGYAGYQGLIARANSGILALAATQGEISLHNAKGRRIDHLTWRDETADGSALVRAPEADGAPARHRDIPAAFGADFSPGYRTDGAAFSAWRAFQAGAVHIGGGRVTLDLRDRKQKPERGELSFRIAIRLVHSGKLVAPITLRFRIRQKPGGNVAITNADLTDDSDSDRRGAWFNFTRFVGDDFVLSEGEQSQFRTVRISNPDGEKFELICDVLSVNYFSLAPAKAADTGSPTLRIAFPGRPASAGSVPSEFTLYGNYPNPFNPGTTLRFTLPSEDDLDMRVVNSLGREVRKLFSGRLTAGEHSLTWDGRDDSGQVLPSGVYFLIIRTSRADYSHRMLLLR